MATTYTTLSSVPLALCTTPDHMIVNKAEMTTEAKQSRPHFTHSPSSPSRREACGTGKRWNDGYEGGDRMEGAKLAMRGTRGLGHGRWDGGRQVGYARYKGTQKMGWRASSWPCAARKGRRRWVEELRWLLCIFISYVLNCSGRTELQDLLWANPVGDCMASRRPVPDSPRATVVDEILPTQPFLGERSRGTYTIVEHLPEWRDRRQIFIALFLFEKNFELGSLISDSIQLVKARQNAGLDAILRQLIIQNQPNQGNNTREFERETRQYAVVEHRDGGRRVGREMDRGDARMRWDGGRQVGDARHRRIGTQLGRIRETHGWDGGRQVGDARLAHWMDGRMNFGGSLAFLTLFKSSSRVTVVSTHCLLGLFDTFGLRHEPHFMTVNCRSD
ncbi:hypothetical protein C8R43DRAFT_955388 [Mycena crocata]|nr:hypothetical protein C8R43DRAFT_955388 [Mycena crocata]